MSNVLVGVVMEDTQLAASYLDVRLLAMIAASFVPLGVSFITKQTASDSLKALVNILGSAIISVLSIWINPANQDVTIWLVLNTFLAAFFASFIAYKGLWKPTGVSPAISAKFPSVGFGSSDFAGGELPTAPVREEEPDIAADLTEEERMIEVPTAGFFAPSDLGIVGEEWNEERDGPIPDYPDERVIAELDAAAEEGKV